jgi:hypothetical protein
MSIKYTDIIRQFDGTEDFSEWIRKLELVAKLQNVKELEKFLPLFLSGGAFSVYESLEEKVKQDYKQLKAALMKSFSFNQFRAYEEFTMRKHLPYESVDVFLSELKKLASLVDGAENNEEWIKCAFVNGLREETKRQLVAVCELQKMSLEDVAGRARMLVSSERSFNAAVAIKKEVDDRKPRSLLCYTCNKEGHISRFCGARKESPVKCYRCGEFGHLASVCSQKEGHFSRYCGARKESPVKCYRCGELGHLASVCSQNVPKNE